MNNASVTADHHGDPQKAALYSGGAALVIFINSMTIASYMLRKKSKRAIPDVLMVSMAVSAIVTMIAVILILAYVRATGNEYFIGLKPLCYIQVYFGTMLRLTDVSTATAITIDRFLALYKPLVYRVNVKLFHGKLVCLLIWIVAALIAMLPLVGFGSVSMHMQSFCTADWTSDITYIVLLLAYSQFVIVLVCYVGIFRAISSLVNRQKTMRKSQSLSYEPTPDAVRRKNGVVSSPLSLKNSNTETSTFYVNSVFEGEEEPAKKSSIDENVKCTHDRKNSNTLVSNSTHENNNDSSKSSGNDPSSPEKVHRGNRHIGIDKSRLRKISSEIVGIFRTRKTRSFKTKNRVSWFNLPEEKRAIAREESKINTIINEAVPENATVVEFSGNLNTNDSCVNGPTEHASAPVPKNETTRKPVVGNNKRFDSVKSDRSKSRFFLKRTSSVASIRTFRTESQHFAKVMGVVVFLFYVSWAPLAVSKIF
jgi:7 transmembrane receptor (rhodopsin family).